MVTAKKELVLNYTAVFEPQPEGGYTVVVPASLPVHKKELKARTLKSILLQAGITPEKLKELI